MRATAIAIIAAAGCASSSQSTNPNDTPPVLSITSPERGAFAQGGMVTVTGSVQDDGPVRVTINGTDVTPAADGSFTANVTLDPGIGILETHAIDQGGHDVRDVRAVLAGTLGTSDGKTAAPLGAHASVAALRAIGNAIAKQAEQINFTQAVQAMNPVYNNGGCLGAVINITSVNIGSIDMSLAPAGNALATEVVGNNVTVKLHADFKVACIGGSTTITVTASKAHIKGNLGVAVNAQKLATSLANPSVTFDNFNIDVGGVPGAIDSLLRGQAQSAAQNAMTKAIQDKVPPLADQALSVFVAKPVGASVLGHDVTATVAPAAATISNAGLSVTVNTKLTVKDGEGGMYLAAPMPMTAGLIDQAQGLGVAIANDTVNQLLAGLWAAGAFDKTMPIASAGPVAGLLDPDAATLELHMSLPPTVTTANGALTLGVGDMMIVAKDASGTELQKIALSVKTTLAASPTQTGKIALTVGDPEVHAQVVTQSENAPRTDAQIEGIVTGVWGLVGDAADQALGNIPMPEFAGLSLGAPSIAGKDGFVVADLALQ